LSSLTAIFGSNGEKSQDSEKLMDLYWNRAELKKAFAGMRQEKFELQDKIKTQKGVSARLQQKIGHLEELLTDPMWAHNVVVFYQLRGLGLQCEQKLAKFAEQLKQQREQKRHSSLMVDWNEQRKKEAQAIKLQLLEQRDASLQLEQRLQFEQRRLISMNGFTRLFRGRSCMKLIDSLADDIEAAVVQERMFREMHSEIEKRQPPDHQGLEIPSKRGINLMIIAFAQQLYIHFSETGIARLIKEASEKSVGSVNYGTQFECGQLLSRISKSASEIDQGTDMADVLQKSARMLSDIAKFPSDADAVPIAGTVATVFRIDSNGMVRESEENLLGENYWDLSTVLSR